MNIDEAQMRTMEHGDVFAARLGRIGPEIGMRRLGCGIAVVEPGKRAFPFHVHHATEEMFMILEGEGTYRFGEDNFPVRAGDVLAAPAGGADQAHQIINTGSSTLKYLMVSTRDDPDVVEYPDSSKVLVYSGVASGGGGLSAKVRHIFRQEGSLDYWDGENGDG